jgi:hypothetical protein
VATGIPNSGKSEFIDALALSLAQNHYWPIAFCSLEKTVVNHFKDLAEKVWGKSFLKDAKNATAGGRISQTEVLLLSLVYLQMLTRFQASEGRCLLNQT